VDLVGLLSNHETSALFQSLTLREWKQETHPRKRKVGVAPDGRRRFGAVRDAIVAVLENAECEVLRARDIHLRVEELLRERVSRGSIKAYLRVGCNRRTPLFEYHGRAGYRLARSRRENWRASGCARACTTSFWPWTVPPNLIPGDAAAAGG
jgi:hypothetical protein